AAQPGDALRCRVAVGPRLADGLLEFFDHMRGGRQVGISHAEIDDIGARIACRGLRAIDLLEDVRRQTPNAVKLFHDPGSLGRRTATAERVRFYHLLRAAPSGLAAESAAGTPAAPTARLRAAT